jgi:hypothetical protein
MEFRGGVGGVYVKYHGCTVYRPLFFECGEEREEMVWSGIFVSLLGLRIGRKTRIWRGVGLSG